MAGPGKMACNKISYTYNTYKKSYEYTPVWSLIKDYEFPDGTSKCALHSVDIWAYSFVFMAIVGGFMLYSQITK